MIDPTLDFDDYAPVSDPHVCSREDAEREDDEDENDDGYDMHLPG